MGGGKERGGGTAFGCGKLILLREPKAIAAENTCVSYCFHILLLCIRQKQKKRMRQEIYAIYRLDLFWDVDGCVHPFGFIFYVSLRSLFHLAPFLSYPSYLHYMQICCQPVLQNYYLYSTPLFPSAKEMLYMSPCTRATCFAIIRIYL